MASAPGPAIKGMASGKTDGSGGLSSARRSRRSVRRSNSMSTAVRNSRTPPEIRKAGMPMPMVVSSRSPKRPNAASRTKAMTQRAQPHPVALLARHALRQGDEQRRQADRVDDDEQRDEGRDQQVEHQRSPAGFEPLQRLEPERLGAGQTVLNLGALAVQRLQFLGVAAGIDQRVGEAGIDRLAHFLQLRHPRLAFRNRGAERSGLGRGARRAVVGFSSRARTGAPPRSDSSRRR